MKIERFAEKKFGVDWCEELTDKHRDEIYQAFEDFKIKQAKRKKKSKK